MNHAKRIDYARKRILKALKSAAVRDGIAQVFRASMQRHIENGAGVDGKFKPLKELHGTWETKRGAEKVQAGYRNGGEPLRDTGHLMRSLYAKAATSGDGFEVSVGGAMYGAYQNAGFETTGPNFIPLTRKGARGYRGGTALVPGKLVKGKDYLIAWNGVTVPSRNFVNPTPDDIHQIGRSIAIGLRATIEGSR